MAGKRVLIVEDEGITGAALRETLEGLGYEAHGPISSGKAAIASALALRPDLILMDIMLKGPISGIKAAEAIRSHHHCPVIYVSGSSDRLKDDLAKVPEPCSFIVKPFDEQELNAAMEKALQQSSKAGSALGSGPSVNE